MSDIKFGFCQSLLDLLTLTKEYKEEELLFAKPVGRLAYGIDASKSIKQYNRPIEAIKGCELPWIKDEKGKEALRDELFFKLISKVSEVTTVSKVSDAFYYLGRLSIVPQYALVHPTRTDLMHEVVSCRILKTTQIPDNMVYIFPQPKLIGTIFLNPMKQEYAFFVSGPELFVRINLSRIITK